MPVLCDTLRAMNAHAHQCPQCGYLIGEQGGICPVCEPGSRMREHVKRGWAMAHWRGVILALGDGGAVVREARAWEETGLIEADVRPLLAQMEEDGDIERFNGYYRVRVAREASP